MVVDSSCPEQFAGRGVDRVDVGRAVADEGRVRRSGRSVNAPDRDSGAHRSGGLKEPVNAAARGIERVDIAALAADVHTPAADRRLRVRGDVAGKPEGPFELQTGHGGGSESRASGILKPRVGTAHTPAVPAWSCER